MKTSNKTNGTISANNGMSRIKFLQAVGLLAAGGAMTSWSSCNEPAQQGKKSAANSQTAITDTLAAGATITPVRVSADPAKLPPPIHRKQPATVQVTLEAKEMVGEIEPGVLFKYMTFNGQVPAPMIRARQGDTVDLTIKNNPSNHNPHNVDFHSCFGSGGGSDYTMVGPGQSKRIRFKVSDPGAFIFHCAVPGLDFHISSGMYGMILVEPENGLPPVDHEFYFGQNEIYASDPVNKHTPVVFDYDDLLKETPKYVVLNGAFNAITRGNYGSLKVKKGETARLYLVNGGPNLISSFHPIGNIWKKAWMQGSLVNEPFHKMQTFQVNPGSCAIFEMDFPVPEIIRLADHSITRTARQGLLAEIEVSGTPSPDLFEPVNS